MSQKVEAGKKTETNKLYEERCRLAGAWASLGRWEGAQRDGVEVLVLNLVLVLVNSYPSVSACTSPIKGSIV